MDDRQVELHVSGRLQPAMVVLLRRDATDRMRRVHPRYVLLVRTVGMLDLVVHGQVMLIVALILAVIAGASQLFSP